MSRRGPTYRKGGVERGKKDIPPSQMESSTVTFCLPCAKYGVSGDSEVSKTQPKHPKNSWSSWQNRNINRQKQHNLGMTMEAWCVSGWGGHCCGSVKEGSALEGGKGTQHGERREQRPGGDNSMCAGGWV